MRRSIWVGFDLREAAAFAVAKHSIRRHCHVPIPIHGLEIEDLRARGLYTRPTSRFGIGLWDEISQAPMSTEFSISRFLAPILAKEGWALFMDSDMLVRRNISNLFALADPAKAVMCVKHNHAPHETVKMDGQTQTQYSRKNWSSLVLFQADHPANKALTLDMINSLPGRDLHRFCWLEDKHIGELPIEWNWLAGHSDPTIDPAIVHFTSGFPLMTGYENQPYADEWRNQLRDWSLK